jgi:hypothetical protein
VADGHDVPRHESLLDELGNCADCAAEFSQLQQTLRLTCRHLESSTPPEPSWTDYHQTLRTKLARLEHETINEAAWWSRVRQTLYTSITIPIPVAVALLIAFAVFALFAFRNQSPEVIAVRPEPSIVRVPVEVPVVKNQVITRVVYRTRNSKRIKRSTTVEDLSGSSVATSRKSSGSNPMNLIGFKPLDEVKLTVIKGGEKNEK